MFNIFPSGTAKDYQRNTEDAYIMPTPKVDSVKVAPKHDYSVGIDDDGNTVLKLHSGITTMSMTLSHSGVRQLVRMLEATLPDQE